VNNSNRDRLSPFLPEPLPSSIDSIRLDSIFTFPTYRLFLTPNPPASRARQDPSYFPSFRQKSPDDNIRQAQLSRAYILFFVRFQIFFFELDRDYGSHSLQTDPHPVLPGPY
jgi:hypothetical protein